ncbi:MAG: hypothetical protein ACREV3_10770, partial [Gammaproteobacteria bacterium]
YQGRHYTRFYRLCKKPITDNLGVNDAKYLIFGKTKSSCGSRVKSPRVSPVPGQDQKEAVSKCLMRRVLDLLREPAAVLKHEGSAAHLLGANQAFFFLMR